MDNKNKYITSDTADLMRSQIKLAEYNPRTITEEGKKALKRSIKLFGVVGGIVVNKRTGNTLVGGHQKVAILDELYKYDKDTKENDYNLRVELIDIDAKKEKELNITLNNPKVGGEWNFDKLREIIPDIDYKDAGLSEEDLSLIGCDYLLQTEEENNLASELEEMMHPVQEAKNSIKQAEKVAHMKEVKKQVAEEASERAKNMEAYIVLSFDTYEAKEQFLEDIGMEAGCKFIKGEVLYNQIF